MTVSYYDVNMIIKEKLQSDRTAYIYVLAGRNGR